jgi:hypothetical protein
MKYLLRTIAITAVMSFGAVAGAQPTESPVPPPAAASRAPFIPQSASPSQQPRQKRTVRHSQGGSITHRYDPGDHVANQLNAQQLGQAAAEQGYAAAPAGPPQHGFPGYGAASYGPPGNQTPAYGAPGYAPANSQGAYPGMGGPGMGGPGMGGPGMGGPGMGGPGMGGPGMGGASPVLAACGSDIRRLCAGVQPGGGRIRQCMQARIREASPVCIEAVRASRGSHGSRPTEP